MVLQPGLHSRLIESQCRKFVLFYFIFLLYRYMITIVKAIVINYFMFNFLILNILQKTCEFLIALSESY